MASTKIPKKEEDKKKKNNDKRSQKNGKALGIIKSPAKGKKSPVAPKPKPKPKSAQKKATPVKTPSKSKTPTKPKREENSAKKKKPEPEELVVPSSSCESEREGGEEHGDEGKTPSKNSKSFKTEVDKKKKVKVKDETEADEDGGEGDDGTMCRFPMARIRRIMRSEAPNLHPGLEGQDVVFLVNRATEMFLEKFSEEGHRSAIDDRKKSLDYKHLATVVSQSTRFDFLSDFVPLKVKAADALEARKSV